MRSTYATAHVRGGCNYKVLTFITDFLRDVSSIAYTACSCVVDEMFFHDDVRPFLAPCLDRLDGLNQKFLDQLARLRSIERSIAYSSLYSCHVCSPWTTSLPDRLSLLLPASLFFPNCSQMTG